ncbi:hypothetical protein PYCC9005_005109 [Savitreella phatthalungensis]
MMSQTVVMLRTSSKVFRAAGSRGFAVKDPFPKQKDSSQGHATSKKETDLGGQGLDNQSDQVMRGKADRKEAQDTIPTGRKQSPEDSTKAPGPVIGMQDERGGIEPSG